MDKEIKLINIEGNNKEITFSSGEYIVFNYLINGETKFFSTTGEGLYEILLKHTLELEKN